MQTRHQILCDDRSPSARGASTAFVEVDVISGERILRAHKSSSEVG